MKLKKMILKNDSEKFSIFLVVATYGFMVFVILLIFLYSKYQGKNNSIIIPKNYSNHTYAIKSGISNQSNEKNPNQQGVNSVMVGDILVPGIGNLVSNHSPSLSSSGYPPLNQEQSVCNTTPGIYCTISFTMNDRTINLPVQKTNDSGAAYWTWTLQQYNITKGSWNIVVKASIGGESKSSEDSTKLNVGS